jgi:hypothetical protein
MTTRRQQYCSAVRTVLYMVCKPQNMACMAQPSCRAICTQHHQQRLSVSAMLPTSAGAMSDASCLLARRPMGLLARSRQVRAVRALARLRAPLWPMALERTTCKHKAAGTACPGKCHYLYNECAVNPTLLSLPYHRC